MSDQATAREKAIGKVHSLRLLAEHPNTPPHEAEAARLAIKRLVDKHGLVEPKAPPTSGPRNPNYRPPNNQRDANRQREQADAFRDFIWRQQERERRDQEAAARAAQAKRRQEAQERYRAKVADKDDLGRPLTEAEKEWARRDPLGFAASRDKRTQADKQRDMNAAWGQATRAANEAATGFREYAKRAAGPRCATPEPFFTAGGEPRKRNTRPIQCDRCSQMLAPGEAMVFEVGGRWFGRCCETKPTPRRKRW